MPDRIKGPVREEYSLFTRSIEKDPKITSRDNDTWLVPLEIIHPDPNRLPHSDTEPFDAFLISSIRRYGVLQPLLLRKRKPEDDNYYIISGERRWRCAKHIGLGKVPVRVLDVNEQQALEVALAESLVRGELEQEEIWHYFRLLHETYGLEVDELHWLSGKSRSYLEALLEVKAGVADSGEPGEALLESEASLPNGAPTEAGNGKSSDATVRFQPASLEKLNEHRRDISGNMDETGLKKRPRMDVRLTRLATELLVMAADPNKRAVALCQGYIFISRMWQKREKGVEEQETQPDLPEESCYEEEELELSDEIGTESEDNDRQERELVAEDFGIFLSHNYRGLKASSEKNPLELFLRGTPLSEEELQGLDPIYTILSKQYPWNLAGREGQAEEGLEESSDATTSES